jgi:hypothetical protein
LSQLPDDTVAGFKGWFIGHRKHMLVALKDSVYQRKSKRVQYLGMLDQWEAVEGLVDAAIEEVFLMVRVRNTENAGSKKT